MVQEASAVLSFATRNYAFFYKDIRILIPESWDHIQANSSTWETWQVSLSEIVEIIEIFILNGIPSDCGGALVHKFGT